MILLLLKQRANFAFNFLRKVAGKFCLHGEFYGGFLFRSCKGSVHQLQNFLGEGGRDIDQAVLGNSHYFGGWGGGRRGREEGRGGCPYFCERISGLRV